MSIGFNDKSGGGYGRVPTQADAIDQSRQNGLAQEQMRAFDTNATLKLNANGPSIDPRIPQLVNIFAKLSNCHQDALIAMAVVLMRIPKESA